MTPEEQRRQNELYNLRRAQEDINEHKQKMEFVQHEYEYGLEKAKKSEPKWEDLTTNQKTHRLLGLTKTQVEYYEQDGRGASMKKEMERERQCIDTTWKDLQSNYGITPGNQVELDRAIDERKEQLQTLDPQKEQSPLPFSERQAAKYAAREQEQAQGEQQVPLQQVAETPQSYQPPEPQHHERGEPHQNPYLGMYEGKVSEPLTTYIREREAGKQDVREVMDRQQIPYEQLYSREAARQAEQLKSIEQGVQQLNTEMQTPQQPGQRKEFDIRAKLGQHDNTGDFGEGGPSSAALAQHHDRTQDGQANRYEDSYKQATERHRERPQNHDHDH